MSSKKARRRERQKKAEARQGRKLSPATLFMLSVGLAMLLVVAVAVFFGDRAEPPWPGAVWSEAHGHWH